MDFSSDIMEMIIIIISSLAVYVLCLLLFRKLMQGGQYKKLTRIDGKIVIITGCNSGIGKETAIDLAKRGGKIYIACRDKKRGEEALEEIRQLSGSDNVYLLQLDLASMESIREFTMRFRKLESQLHILINNAGILGQRGSVTMDGFELHFGTNHLGPFLLTNLLLDLMKVSAPSRVIVVSSMIHRVSKIDKDDLMSDKNRWRWLIYGQSKLANILFANELARKLEGTGVTANSLHPGVTRTNFPRNLGLLTRLFYIPYKYLVKTTKSGAQTQIRLAVDPELENVSGKFFRDCKQVTPSESARDVATAEWLWRKSEELTQLVSV